MHNVRVETGHVSRFWDDSFKKFTFIKQSITKKESKTWTKQGYDYIKSFVGSMYDNSNPMPDWLGDLEQAFDMYDQTYTFYRMNTLEIMPTHTDHFRTYCKLNETIPDKVQRVVLMLEDWKPGHYFELDGIGYVNWKAGDWFKWTGDIPHAASNIGIDPRYTLQITGKSIYEGQLNNLFYHNIPGLRNNCGHLMLKYDILPKVPEKHAMLYMANRHITQLKDINHSTISRAILNKEGLHIYLYEPLSSYDAKKPEHNMGFYSEFKAKKPKNLRAEELDSISEYVERNRLNNVVVHTCDYNVDKWYSHYKNFNLICDDLFLKTQKLISNLDTEFKNQFNQTFVCLNWRFTNHRQLVSTFLAGDSGYLSWYYKADFEQMNTTLFFDLKSWEKKHTKHYCRLQNNVETVMKKSPFVVDIEPDKDPIENVDIYPSVVGYESGQTPALHNLLSNRLSDVYVNSFVDIIAETRFAQPTANFSEQVLQAIQYQKPFILVAPPKTLEYIRSLGFKTFGDFWDESYDNEYDHGERLAKIFDILEKIMTTSNDELRDMYEQMRPIVEHNLETFKEFIKK